MRQPEALEYFEEKGLDTLEKQIEGVQELVTYWQNQADMWKDKYEYTDAYAQSHRYRSHMLHAELQVFEWSNILKRLKK